MEVNQQSSPRQTRPPKGLFAQRLDHSVVTKHTSVRPAGPGAETHGWATLLSGGGDGLGQEADGVADRGAPRRARQPPRSPRQAR